MNKRFDGNNNFLTSTSVIDNNFVRATHLKSSSSDISITDNSPSTGQVLKAISSNNATWQTINTGNVNSVYSFEPQGCLISSDFVNGSKNIAPNPNFVITSSTLDLLNTSEIKFNNPNTLQRFTNGSYQKFESGSYVNLGDNYISDNSGNKKIDFSNANSIILTTPNDLQVKNITFTNPLYTQSTLSNYLNNSSEPIVFNLGGNIFTISFKIVVVGKNITLTSKTAIRGTPGTNTSSMFAQLPNYCIPSSQTNRIENTVITVDNSSNFMVGRITVDNSGVMEIYRDYLGIGVFTNGNSNCGTNNAITFTYCI